MSNGILLVDKPQAMTSHDVVARVRKIAQTKKVGHAGTLDPLATGLLVLGLNASTRLLTYLVGLDKTYVSTFRFGETTDTDDSDGNVTSWANPQAMESLHLPDIQQHIKRFTGHILQVPSAVSAIKIDGKRAYERMREGLSVELKPRLVTVPEFEVLELRQGDGRCEIDVVVSCSSGTYIRSLARDLGEALGVGGHVSMLRRTRVGPFRIEHSRTLEKLDIINDLHTPANIAAELFEQFHLSTEQEQDLKHGRVIDLSCTEVSQKQPIAALSSSGELIGLFERVGNKGKVLTNFPT